MEELTTGVLVLGSGGAGLMAALHAAESQPGTAVMLATKGLLGKCGCTRMVQGGYNAVMDAADSTDSHFLDTMKGGKFLNNEQLAWRLVIEAPAVVRELETKIGVFWYRKEDGSLHQKPLAGQSFARTVHRGDLTGIEIVSRLADHVMNRPNVQVLEETRLLDLVFDEAGQRIGGALLLSIRTGQLILVHCPAVILATGGAAPLFRISSASLEKSGDGFAAAYRAGVELMDMEMTQFHPTGLLAGNSRLNGSVLAEELRTLGGRLFNVSGERFMQKYFPEKMEAATRDQVSQAIYREMKTGVTTPRGGMWLDLSHLGADYVQKKFPGMVDRVAMTGIDLSRAPVEVSPTSHFNMGGVVIDVECRTELPGLFVAGEDAGGVHGANRLGGNGVADSTVFGRVAGKSAAAYAVEHPGVKADVRMAGKLADDALAPVQRPMTNIHPATLRDELRTLMWDKVGVVRDGAEMQAAIADLADLRERAERVGAGGPRTYNLTWNDALNLRNLQDVAEVVTQSAIVRTESRGAHYRIDFPETDNQRWLKNICVRRTASGECVVTERPVKLTRLFPDEVDQPMTTAR